jgi:large exoprotein involved in heme utilization and adhesion
MRDGAVIRASNFEVGRGGHLRITADTMLLEGVGGGDPTGLFAQATTSTSTGDAGDLAVNVNHLTMRDGAAIGVSTFGAGRGGDLRVTTDTMLLEGVHEGDPTAAPTHVLYCNLLINIAARQELVRQNISSFYNSLKI